MHHNLFAPYSDFLEHTLAFLDVPKNRLARLRNGAQVRHPALGILTIEPPGQIQGQAIISAGIHGNETAPVEICDALVEELLAERWTPGLRTMIILGNPRAMVTGTRFVDFNLNRLFGGIHRQAAYRTSIEAARAEELERWVTEFVTPEASLVHYDLHTAIRPSRYEKFALYPFVPGRRLPDAQARFLLDSDVDTVLHQHKPGSTFSSWTSTTFGAESFTVELGQVKPFGQNDHSRFRGIRDSLRNLLQGHWPQADAGAMERLRQFRVVHEIINTGPGFMFHIPDDVANFTEYPPGTLIWEDAETRYTVGPQPEAIVFPNRDVPVGQRVGLLVTAGMPEALSQETVGLRPGIRE